MAINEKAESVREIPEIEKQTPRIKKGALQIGQKGSAGIDVGIPEGKNSSHEGFPGKCSKGVELIENILNEKTMLCKKNFRKKKKRKKKKKSKVHETKDEDTLRWSAPCEVSKGPACAGSTIESGLRWRGVCFAAPSNRALPWQESPSP